KALKAESGKNQSIPVRAKIDARVFEANVVKYLGFWRVYLNGPMRKAIGKDVGDRVSVTLTHDPAPRRTPMRPAFAKALKANKRAKACFEALAPSRRKEILRYLNNLKGAEAIERYIRSTISMLSSGKPITR
ncbi:MAG TPA: YdeI/OmpD-associated family protein, partial [Gammaproteobacteria bacterium]